MTLIYTHEIRATELPAIAIFEMNGRRYLKCDGVIRRFDRSGTQFDAGSQGWIVDTNCKVEVLDLSLMRPGSSCTICYGDGYVPGTWDVVDRDPVRRPCPNGCIDPNKTPEIEKPKEPEVCEHCKQLLVKSVVE